MKIGSGRFITMAFIAILAVSFSATSQEAWQQPPDQVLRPSVPRRIAAGTPPQAHRFSLGTDQVKDRWIRGIDFRPGDPRVVQRAFFYVEKTGQWIGAWLP